MHSDTWDALIEMLNLHLKDAPAHKPKRCNIVIATGFEKVGLNVLLIPIPDSQNDPTLFLTPSLESQALLCRSA